MDVIHNSSRFCFILLQIANVIPRSIIFLKCIYIPFKETIRKEKNHPSFICTFPSIICSKFNGGFGFCCFPGRAKERAYLVQQLTQIADPVLIAFSQNKLKKEMPVEAAPAQETALYAVIKTQVMLKINENISKSFSAYKN